MNNLNWNVYRSLERELLDIADTIHVDDKQLSTYSMRIANLLVRTVIEIESISKELYFREGGVQPAQGNDLYFDTDCLALLENKWTLSKKVVMISSPLLYLEDISNLRLTPLHKAFKRGHSGSAWKQAYQAVKHDRSGSLNKGSIKHFIHALGALFLLNLYYQEQKFSLYRDPKGKKFDANVGSSLFSIEIYRSPKNLLRRDKGSEPLDQYTYLICSSDESKKKIEDLLKGVAGNEQAYKQIASTLKKDPALLREIVKALKYEAVLNKSQY